ncbi:hypothetical protein D8S78_02165 [Natrialba swarupiae]|nr:hypothetical protein [Natrialba swarupiae]
MAVDGTRLPAEELVRRRTFLDQRATDVVVVQSDHPNRPFVRRPGMDHVAFHASSRRQIDRITDETRHHD